VRAALPAWLTARGVVLAALAAAAWAHDGLPQTGTVAGATGLQVWDTAWYRLLADEGYHAQGPDAVRFFPLLPLATRAVAAVLGLPTAVVLIALCWVCGLGFAALLHRLVLAETGDPASARRAAWLIQLVPGANVLALGYTEAPAGLLATAFFLLLRRGWLAGAATVGLLSGLVRPTGLLLALPAVVELTARLRAGHRPGPGWYAVAASPVLGTATYLGWCWTAYGDFLLPYRVQTAHDLRGGVVDVRLSYLVRTSPAGWPWPLVLLLLAAAAWLLWLCPRRLPAAYPVWAAAAVAAGATAYGFHSLPRYLAAVFPLVMVLAKVSRSRAAWYCTLAACLPPFAYVSYVSFTSQAVP
jgi:hypothetical protein